MRAGQPKLDRRTQYGWNYATWKEYYPDHRAAVRERNHIATESFCTFSSATFAAAASVAAAALMAGMVVQ